MVKNAKLSQILAKAKVDIWTSIHAENSEDEIKNRIKYISKLFGVTPKQAEKAFQNIRHLPWHIPFNEYTYEKYICNYFSLLFKKSKNRTWPDYLLNDPGALSDLGIKQLEILKWEYNGNLITKGSNLSIEIQKVYISLFGLKDSAVSELPRNLILAIKEHHTAMTYHDYPSLPLAKDFEEYHLDTAREILEQKIYDRIRINSPVFNDS